jgi:site-specific recombinase XerD
MKAHEIDSPEGAPPPVLDGAGAIQPSGAPPTRSNLKWKFLPVLDSRNRRIPHLETRNGRFIAQLWTDRGDGKKTARRFALLNPDGAPVRNIPEAKEALERLRQGRREDTLPTMGQKPTVEACVATYLASGRFAAKRFSSRRNEKYSLQMWVAHCGSVRVDKLNAAHVASFIDRRLKGEPVGGVERGPAGERTVTGDLVALRNLLNAAINAGHLRALPRMPELKLPPVRKKVTVPPADVERLIETAVRACPKNGEQLQDYLRLLCYCGAREAETLQLRWADVDFGRGVLTIGSDGASKNRRDRTVEFNSSLAAHLQDMHARRAPDSQWLFPSPQRGESDRPSKSFRESLNLARSTASFRDSGFMTVADFLRRWQFSQALIFRQLRAGWGTETAVCWWRRRIRTCWETTARGWPLPCPFRRRRKARLPQQRCLDDVGDQGSLVLA